MVDRAQRPPRPTTPGAYHDHDVDDLPQFLTGQLNAVRPEAGEAVEVDPEVLSTLIDLGVDEADARQAILEDRVALVMSQQVLEDTRDFTIEDVAVKADLEVETIRLLRSALGLPDEERFGQLDVNWACQIAKLLEVLSMETVLRSGRSRGASLATIALSDMGVIRDELILPLRRAGADDLTIGIALAEATKAIMPISHELLQTTYDLQLRHLLSTELAATATRGATAELRVAVGFVDIVGYTRLSARIDPTGLDTLIEAFERRVVEVVSARRDVAVVKYLGDAAMLVAPDAVTLADAMLELATEVPALADAPVRGGLAVGDVLARDGDYFGPTVNLAARLTDITRPWRVLVEEGAIEDVRAHFEVERVRPLRLRGIGTSRPGSIRRRLTETERADRDQDAGADDKESDAEPSPTSPSSAD